MAGVTPVAANSGKPARAGARPTTAADALGNNAAGVVASGVQDAAVVDSNCAPVAAGIALPTKRDYAAGVARTATATADALGFDGVRAPSHRLN